ncbi:FkbM family methyltransferase [Candidatus Dependentiae bacterium]|nr:FkbM family methyltransferase [Candidatus Dependentiae bacterium]MBU4386928.1 FkbM family methyltransferase [Candidatus Dependentiae bacterium]MCG2756405.1 FkbM family methyltransferase [Candidatus Dependentiae bacterium]
MSIKKTIFLVLILNGIFLSLFIRNNKQSKIHLHNFARIIKQELTEPEIKYQNRIPSFVENIYKYFVYLFSTDHENLPAINHIRNFKILSNTNTEFYTLYQEIFTEKLYYFDLKNEKPFIVDCGSNIGMSILFFKLLYPNSEILGFEPSNINFNLLKKNIENNKLDNTKIFKKALSNKIESLKLYGTGTPLGSIISDNPHNRSNYEIIETDLLSNYINKKVDLLKIDTEGAETLIIEDLDSKNKLNFIDKIIMEYHHFTTQNKLSNLLSILEKNNFAYQICSDQHPPMENRLAQHFFIYAYKK